MSCVTAESSIWPRPPFTTMSPFTVSTLTLPLVPRISTLLFTPEISRFIQAGTVTLRSTDWPRLQDSSVRMTTLPAARLTWKRSSSGSPDSTRTWFLSHALTVTSPENVATWSAVPEVTEKVVSAVEPMERAAAAATTSGRTIMPSLLRLRCACELGGATHEFDLAVHRFVEMRFHVRISGIRFERALRLFDRHVDDDEAF